MNWEDSIKELENLTPQTISSVNSVTADILHGSMWGLNHRYTNVSTCLSNDWDKMICYSLDRLRGLIDLPDISFKSRKIYRCRIGYGTYGWKYDADIIKEALRHGVSVIDTAEGYGYGKVEAELGKVLSGVPYENVASKVSRNHMSPKALPAAASRSVTKLQRPVHYQIHFPNDKYSEKELGISLVRLRQQRCILSIGLGNCSVDMIEAMQRFLSDFSGDIIRSVQVRYSLIDRRIETCLLPYCQKRGIVVLAYSPLGQSFHKLHKPVLDRIAKKHNCTPSQVALGWLLNKRGVIPIPRTNNIKHLQENMKANGVFLTKEDMDILNSEYPISIFN